MAHRAASVPGSGETLRSAMVLCAQRLSQLGLNRGSTGNIGVRLQNSFLVTPSGIPAEELMPQMMVEVDFSGTVLGTGKPSSEWRFHRDILAARAEIGAVVHTHSRYATSLACMNRDIPAFHYMIAAAGGHSIRCAPYALFGTQELSNLALQALRERKACLLGNHGTIALGTDLKAAFALTLEVESLCQQYWTALQIGEPKILSNQQMLDVMEKFRTYGSGASA